MKRLWQIGAWLAVPVLVGAALSSSSAVAQKTANKSGAAFESKVVNRDTKGQAVDVEIDLTNAKGLWLVATDGGDGFGCDWADWIEPKLIGPKGELKLTELKWKSASSGFGEVKINANCGGNALSVAGKKPEFGIGAHANSVIEYALPEGYTKFTARAALDDQGTNQGCGSTVQFMVFTNKPDPKVIVASAAAAAPQAAGSREPQDAISGLDVAEGLEATLFASEASKPAMLNPTSIDIDHLGRVWVCEVVNYRHRNGERKEGDRILILEDTNGDGVGDKQTVFYQGHDVDSAHGICVLPTPSGKGTKIIVSCGSDVFYLHDDDGDLKSDRKELLFTGIAGTQHDHGIHAFHFGPDGKLYFNFGNSGNQIKDKDGKQIVDLSGNEVNASRKPYQEGMVFRCNVDGSEFETLGWDFRNNWEIAVDSFGALWQSDNDDDGNKGVRINFVMEFGNYGYKDEFTGAGWTSPRTNIEQEIPLRHWHLNDPGVVPNLLQTGAGSPTGILVYEGDLLPEVFRNQVIHCDAGPNVVRAYPTKKSGAGYTAEIVNVLTGARDNWFRPSDVCVAPDGSLFVADWYDPGVGGHRMGDADRGRLFRLAPPKTPYKTPKVDVSTIEGAIAALKSPNEAARYLAWTALHAQGAKAEAALTAMFEKDANPRQRARAMWLLGNIPGKAQAVVDKAITDKDEDIRAAGLRLARRLKLDVVAVIEKFRDARDTSAVVRRESAIALRFIKSDKKPQLWAQVANTYEGNDRWLLEALGIGAGNDWDACLDAYLKQTNGVVTTQAARDIIWRSRATQTPTLLAKLLADSSVSADEAPRYIRAFDFLNGQAKDDALVQVAFSSLGDEKKTQFANAEAIGRLKGFDVSKNPQQKAALNRVLDGLKGQAQFITLVEKFSVADRYADLAALASSKGDEQIGIDAARVLLGKGAKDVLEAGLKSTADNGRAATGLATALSNTGDGSAAALLLPIVQNEKAPADQRRQAIKGATRTKPGASAVLKLAESKAFDDSFAPALAAALSTAPLDAAQQANVAKLFPAPAGKDSKPLPSIGELAKLKGDKGNGQKVFASQIAKCSSCHVVNGQGKEVGPNLSEIGSKLSRQAFFESIIFPSAGISHNYELYSAIQKDGTIFNGIMISSTDDSVTLRNAESITKTIKTADLEEPLVKQKVSIMPADVAKQLSQEELVDVVEYLTTLKKK
jgi:putative membrane-bound dehydrogenase-like protein